VLRRRPRTACAGSSTFSDAMEGYLSNGPSRSPP
jgi:hypothetical protein